MGVTIKDIADACNVSKATVSRFINGSGYVSEDAAEKIEAKIKELNYVPSATARSLSTNKSNVIGVIIPEVDNPFFGEVFKGISEVAERYNLNILYCNTDNNCDKELKALKMLREYRIQGVVLTPATDGLKDHHYNREFIECIEALKAPVVLLDRDVQYVNWDGVFIDNFKGAFNCTKILIENGHKSIATITGDMNLQIGRDRHEGFKRAMEDHNLEMMPDLILEGDFSIETAYMKTKELLKSEVRPTAIFSPNNLTTMGILKALTEVGLTIPNDISLVGFDDIEVLNMLHIGLTVVHRDTVDMGKKAMELLVKRIKADKMSEGARRVVITPDIILRGSEKLINP